MRSRNPLLVAALGLFLITGVASAQCPDQVRAAVQREIDLTDTRIEQADALAAGSDNAEVRSDLALANDLQSRAKIELDAGHCVVALDLTKRARARALHAVSLVRGLPDPDRVQVQLERTREILDRARERIEECDQPRAQAMLRAALQMQTRAEAAFAADPPRLLAALQLTVSARERVHRALGLCNIEESLQDGAERALKRTDDVLGRAREKTGDAAREQGRRALDHALELQQRAYDEFRAGRFEASLRLTLQSRAIAFRALRLAGGS
jgi:hypothetical protein